MGKKAVAASPFCSQWKQHISQLLNSMFPQSFWVMRLSGQGKIEHHALARKIDRVTESITNCGLLRLRQVPAEARRGIHNWRWPPLATWHNESGHDVYDLNTKKNITWPLSKWLGNDWWKSHLRNFNLRKVGSSRQNLPKLPSSGSSFSLAQEEAGSFLCFEKE